MKYCIFFLFAFCFSCNENSNKSNVDYYNILSISKPFRKQLINGIRIDTIRIDNDMETSYKGYFKVYRDTIYYSDELFNYVFRFNKKGELLDKNIGKGVGKNEIKGFHDNIFIGNTKIYVNELNSELSFFDHNYKKFLEYEIDWQIKRTKVEALNNPDPLNGDAYEFDFGIPDNFKQWDEDHLAFAITTSHPNFNGYYDSEDYYKKSRIIALIDTKSGNVVDLIGRRSPELLKYKYLPNFDHFNYEIFKNHLYVNFWCDSLIYQIDKKTKSPIDKFGFEGINIKNDYIETKDYPTAKNRWKTDQKDYGYYSYLKVISEKDLLLRGYKKGNSKDTEGLQIYQRKNLIGDIEVPLGLKIIGVIDGDLIAYNTIKKGNLELYKIYLNYEK